MGHPLFFPPFHQLVAVEGAAITAMALLVALVAVLQVMVVVEQEQAALEPQDRDTLEEMKLAPQETVEVVAELGAWATIVLWPQQQGHLAGWEFPHL